MTANSTIATVSCPSGLENCRARNTGIPASRAKPMAFGIVHGLSGWPDSVASGGGPERSIPNKRRFDCRVRTGSRSGQLAQQLDHRRSGLFERHGARVQPSPDLDLNIALLERSPPDRHPQGTSE